jgi:hypothetical protein
MKLPFQLVVIHRKRIQTSELCLLYFSVTCCPEQISGRLAFVDLAITVCRNLRLPLFLIHWNRNFMRHLNIQEYSLFSLRDRAEFWWHQWLLVHWFGDVGDLDLFIFECHVALPCCRFRASTMLSISLGMEEEYKAFLSYPFFNFLIMRVLILPAKHFKHTFYPKVTVGSR